MGVPHTGMQGMVLADALTAPPSWAVQRQQATNRQLLPLVTAMQQESRLELASGR